MPPLQSAQDVTGCEMNIFKKISDIVAQHKLGKDRENFMICITRNDIDGVRTYLSNGLDPNFGPANVGYYAPPNDFPPLFAAAKMWRPEIVQLLLDYKTDPQRTLTQGDDMGFSPHISPFIPKNALGVFIEYMRSIDSYAPPHHTNYPVSSETALRVYEVLRSVLDLSTKDQQTINSNGRSLQLFAAWEQKMRLQTAVVNENPSIPTRSRRM